MNSKELRLGNYLQGEDGQIHVVESLNSYGGEEINEDGPDVYYEPIPISQKWLLNLGFKSQPESQSFWYPDSHLWLRANKTSFRADSQHDILADVSYIHQLQNLYFALTGEELTLK